MNIREHFEESALSRGLVVRRVFGDEAEAEGLNDGDYLFQETRLAWDWFQSAWGASRAAMVETGADIEFLDVVKVWRTGEYIGIFEAQIIAGCKKTGVIGTVALENIRPAKSEAEKERQAVIREMMETVCKGTPWTLSADA